MFLGNPFGIIPAFITFGIGTVLLVVLTLCEKEKVSEGAKEIAELTAKNAEN